MTHFIGIGGIGMSGLAKLLLLKKEKVTGSDQRASDLTAELTSLGAVITFEHDIKNLPVKGTVVISSSIRKDNPERVGCQPGQHKVLHRSELLAQLMQGQRALLVAGTHGKTTTSSLLATVLTEAELQPSWAVGGIVSRYNTNAALGSGDYFVAEADESDGTHLRYTPYGLIMTSLNQDHLDHYLTQEALIESFEAFFAKVLSREHFFWCGDSSSLRRLSPQGVSYGYNEGNDLRITGFVQEGRHAYFDIAFEGKNFKNIEIPLMGRHNALNASAVFGLALRLGISESAIRKGLQLSTGSKRRLELKSEEKNSVLFDDYAHHPAEIAATLAAVRAAYPENRLIVAFQPHRYSRTRDCFHEFAPALQEADILLVTDIYAAGESPLEGITTAALLSTMPQARYAARKDISSALKNLRRPFDIMVTLGAGDITKVSDEVAQVSPCKLKVACIFGGRSGEHEITLLSAKTICHGFDPNLVDVHYFAIDKQGRWICGEEAASYLKSPYSSATEVFSAQVLQSLKQCDAAFPIFHGPMGEDGTIQGFLEILGIPYVGCGVESSAIAMNKATTKKLALSAGLPIADFVDFTAYEWDTEKSRLLETIDKRLTYPLFVKPVHLGSTLGIKKVNSEEKLREAIKEAFRLDTQLLVEQGVICRELECAIVGRGPWLTSIPGEVFSKGEVYNYEGKYGETGVAVSPVADLTLELRHAVQQLALQAYRAIGCDGMARVDLFLTDKGQLLLNEINPIPGFTKNSLFPKMCEGSGRPMADLLSLLMRLAISRKCKSDKVL